MRNALTGVFVGAASILALLGVVKARTDPPADRGWALALEQLPSPAGENSTAPRFTVEGERVILSWLERARPRATLKFVERTESGWSDPRIVVSGDDVMVNSADVPSVRVFAAGTLVAHWLQNNGPNPEAYDLRLSWSRDGGQTWSKPTSPHHDGTKTQHGFASLFQAPGAGLGLVWLDGRATNPETEQGNMSLRAAVYGTDGKQRSETAVDLRVCECCPTSAAMTSEGPISAFRNRSAQDVRDIYVSRFVSGRWSTPVAVHHDGWRIIGCPVNGPAISARNRDVVVAWFTVQSLEGHAFVAFSRDAGRTFGTPIRVDDVRSVGRVDISLLADGSVAVSWVEFAEERSQFKVRRIQQSGARSTAIRIGDIGGAHYPRLARAGDELLFAWSEASDGSSRVRTARASIPK